MEQHLIAALAVLTGLLILIGAPVLVGKLLDWLLQRLTQGKYCVSGWRTFLWTWIVVADIAFLTAICTGKRLGNPGPGGTVALGVLFIASFAMFPITRKSHNPSVYTPTAKQRNNFR